MSEIGIIADPMIPKAWPIPWRCSTFTKASSVVIFIGLILDEGAGMAALVAPGFGGTLAEGTRPL